MQSTRSHPICLRSIFISSSDVRLFLPCGLVSLSSPTKIVYAFLIFPFLRKDCVVAADCEHNHDSSLQIRMPAKYSVHVKRISGSCGT
jgi:hypothetical protein